jgi:ABC-type dipeptide transport system, periplasmic component
MSIMDKKVVESAKNFGIDPAETIGSGPYIVSDWKVNESITLVKNENYWQKIDNGVNKVILYIVPDSSTQSLMYQNGQLDLLDMDYLDSSIVESTYKTQYANNIVTGHRVGLTYFALSENNKYLSDINVRKAIQMAVDRQGIIDQIYGGNAIEENGIIPSGVWGHNDNLTAIQYDPAGAKALLAKAGYTDGEINFEISLDNSSSGNTQLVIQKIQQDLAAVGITANIVSYDESSWLDLRKSGKMDSFVATWTMDYNDPANIMYTFFGSADKTLLRSLNYPDTDIMARVAAANSIMDDSARMAEYQTLEKKIVSEDSAWVPLLENSHLFAISSRVASFTPQWAGYTDFYVRDITLK